LASSGTLEQRWNHALEEAQRLKDDYQKYRQQERLELTGKQQSELLALCCFQHLALRLLPAGATVAGWVIFLPLDQRALSRRTRKMG